MGRAVVLLGSACLAITCTSSGLLAQTIRGRVLEAETGAPVPSAVVLASWAGGDTIGTTVTGPDGRFSVRTLRSGRIVLRAERIGLRAVITEPIQLGAGDVVSIDIEMPPSPVALEAIVVRAIRKPEVQGTVLDAFQERRHWLGERLGLGTFMNREQIESRNAAQLSDLIKTLPGVRLVRAGAGTYDVIVGRMPDCERSQIYLDGIWMNRVSGDLDSIAIPSMLAGVEVYRGGAQMPAEFGGFDSRCGVIALWTERGR